MKNKIIKNNYEILENEMLYRTNCDGLFVGILRIHNYLDKELDTSILNEFDKLYEIFEALDQKGVKELYFEDCRKKKCINTISKNVDSYYINEITDALLLTLNDIRIYGDTSLIDILFNERYMSILNDYYQGKHTKESFENALKLE